MIPHRLRLPFAALCCALLLAPTTPAQADPPTPPPAPADTEPPQKLDAWPELEAAAKDRLLPLVGQLKKADPELRAAAAKDLEAIGAAGVPLLFQQVSDRTGNVNDQLFALFDVVLGRQHAALMARECKKPRVELRRYLIRRLCTFADKDVLPVLQATTKDKDESTAFYAQLGVLALRQREGIAPVLAYTKTHWKDVGAFVASVLPAARSSEVGTWVFDSIAAAPVADQMAGLRLLRYVATRDQASMLRRYLEASDHNVRKEAINTARVLHGEEPMENMPVFQAIELSKEWLKKL